MRIILLLAAGLVLTGCGDGDDSSDGSDDGASEDGGDAIGDGGGTADGGGESVDCEALDPVTCKRTSVCRVLTAFAVVPDGDEYCEENHDEIDVGCTFIDKQCVYVTSWAADPGVADQCYIFGDCKPKGWGNCDVASKRTTNPCP